nr:MAG: hypothetical protein 3 [Leviviridae sp.]
MRKIPHWLEDHSSAESLDILCDIALSHSRKGGIQGSFISSLIEAGDFRALCEYEVDYHWKGWTIPHLVECRQALAFFSKLDFLEIGVDKERTAFTKFVGTESLCRETNEAFKAWSEGRFNFRPSVDAVLFAAQRKIAHVLGSVPSTEKLRFRFGPGATTLTKKRDANPLRKLGDGVACSEDLALMAAKLLGEMPCWAEIHRVKEPTLSRESVDVPREVVPSQYDFGLDVHPGLPRQCLLDFSELDPEVEYTEWLEVPDDWSDLAEKLVIPGWVKQKTSTAPVDTPEITTTSLEDVSVPVQIMDGRLTFVAKNALTHRAIVTEPPLNGVYQLALGDYIAKRLAKFGVDLSDQTRNQRLAKEGSLTGALATLDLSSASDTIAIEVVYHLLPVDWALALSVGRSSHILYKGERFNLEKFSSMGNGYTFALESLIFWALASSCSESGEVSVYGDDIIVPTTSVALLTEVLTACGFLLNARKSYSHGPFRESCGADWYRGFDIRPYYQKKLVAPADLFKLHNFYVRHGLEDRAMDVRKYIHPSLFLFGPDGFGDGHLLALSEQELSSCKRRKVRHGRMGYSGYVFDTLKYTGLRDSRTEFLPGDYAFSLYTIYQRSSEKVVSDRVREQIGSHLSVGSWASSYRAREHLRFGSITGEAIPEYQTQDGSRLKLPSVPGSLDYKRTSVYTLQ